MQDVELLDAAQFDATTAIDGPDAPRGTGRPSRLRRYYRWLVPAVVIVALAAGGTQWTLDRREQATLARIADIPAVLAPVGTKLTITKRIAADDLGPLLAEHTAGELTRADDGSQSFIWPATPGRAGWTAPLMGPTPRLADLGRGQLIDGTACQSTYGTESRTASSVVCLVTDGGVALHADGEYVPVTKSTRQVVVLSTRDGSIRGRWDAGTADSFIALPHGQVALAWGDKDGTTVAGYAELTGRQSWSRTDPYPDGFGYAPDPTTFVSIFPVADLIAYVTASSGVRLLGQDGTLVREVTSRATASGFGWTDGPGAQITVEHTTDTGGTRTTFLAADGDPAGDVTVDGKPVPTPVDDGSISSLLLTSDTRLYGWNRQAGIKKWQADLSAPVMAIVLRGRVFVLHATGVAALDGDSGAPLWTAKPRAETPSMLLTDGRHILVVYPSITAGRPATLVAYDPATGHQDFEAPFPTGIDAWGPTTHHQLIGTDTTTGEYVILG